MHNILHGNTDNDVLRELGARLRAYRLQQNARVEEVAAKSGLSRNTIVNAENGRNPRLLTVIRLLRAYGRLDNLDAFLPPQLVSPLQLLRTHGRLRKRARRSG